MRWLAALVLAVFSMPAAAKDGNFLNVAILTLPKQYLADIPYSQRGSFLTTLSFPSEAKMLNYQHGWMHSYSDNPYETFGSSMLWIKLLPRIDGNPLVFVHMAKPFATGTLSPTKQTFILDRNGDKWEEVTKTYLPKSIDLASAFIPRRERNEIEVASYQRVEAKKSIKRDFYTFGPCFLVLRWNGTSFDQRTVESRKINFDD